MATLRVNNYFLLVRNLIVCLETLGLTMKVFPENHEIIFLHQWAGRKSEKYDFSILKCFLRLPGAQKFKSSATFVISMNF